MNKEHDKIISDLHRLIETQNFKSEEEMHSFLNGLIGQTIPSLFNEDLTDQEAALDLVFEAYKLPPDEARLEIEMALDLDPDCIEAHEFLGLIDPSMPIAIVFYEKGIALGRHQFEATI